MEEERRKTKQALIAVIFFLVVGGLGFLIYRGFVPAPAKPTPSPMANLAPVQIVFTKLFNVENYDYDFLAKVANPNADYGASSVDYEISFFNAAEMKIAAKSGNFYILPGQIKYLIVSPVKLEEAAARIELHIKSIDWQKLNPMAAGGVNLIVRNTVFVKPTQAGVFAKTGGDVFNSSDFDLNKVETLVILFDSEDTPLAVGKTEIYTFLAGTSRGFEVSWHRPFVGNVARIDAEANTNVFENTNFLRQYGGQERFKEMY